MTDGLEDKYRRAIIEILSTNPRINRAVLFGSRAMGTHTTTSDVDIVLFGDELTLNDHSELAEAIAELTIPQRVDILLYRTIRNNNLLGHIEKHGVEWYRRFGGMGSEWAIGTLDQLIDFKPKRTIRKNSLAPFVAMADIATHSRAITNIGTKEYKGGGSRFQNGDTLFARITPCLENGKTAKVSGLPDDTVAHGSTEFIVMAARHPYYDQDYIYYLARLPGFRKYAESRMEGTSGRQRVSWQALSGYELRIPPKTQRKYIGTLLSSLDNRIELNWRMNATLESMAQALFKSWFVGFDPVLDNALTSGKEIPEELIEKAQARVALGDMRQPLPEEIRTLFPDEFTYSDELGWIPKGWEVKTFNTLIELIGGGTPKTSVEEFWGGDIPWFSVVDAPSFANVFVIDTEKHVSQLGIDKSSTKILPVGTTIISARGTVGKCAFVGRPMAMNQYCYGIRGKRGIADSFVYYAVRNQVEHLQRSGHGSVFNTITRDTFKIIKMAIGEAEYTQRFEGCIKPFLDKILANNIQNIELSKLRDTLLPKLLSGEIRIPDAENMTKELGL